MGIEKFKDKYQGERIFLVGNGPSLSKTPLEKLEDEYSLALNRINKIYSETDWRPSFYYFANSSKHRFSNQIKENISLDIPCFLYSDHSEIIENYDNVYGFDRVTLYNTEVWDSASLQDIREMPREQLMHFWSDNPQHHIYHYHSMYGAIQLAVYMGFDEIYFIGCDLGMEYKNPHIIFTSGLDPVKYSGTKKEYLKDLIWPKTIIQSSINTLAYLICNNARESKLLGRIFGKKDSSHFADNYLSALDINEGERNSREIKKTHIAAKIICEKKEVDLFNATIGGELEVYPRVNIDEILQKPEAPQQPIEALKD